MCNSVTTKFLSYFQSYLLYFLTLHESITDSIEIIVLWMIHTMIDELFHIWVFFKLKFVDQELSQLFYFFLYLFGGAAGAHRIFTRILR